MSKHIYISGIGGSGLFALSQLALDCGYRVSGSDIEDSPHIQWLKERGVTVFLEQSGQGIAKLHAQQPIDWFIGTSALPAEHAELKFAQEKDIKISKRDEFIKQIIKDKQLRLVAVSGTHGKTTVTGMLLWLFNQLGLPVSYSIGTDITYGPCGQYAKGSEYFLYEADEFDRNFLAFQPYASLIPSVEYDHADTYPTVGDYKQAFKQFVSQSHCCYLFKAAADYLEVAERACLHELEPADDDLADIKLAGAHNRLNGYLALQAAKDLFKGFDYHLLVTALNQFPGTSRRMERLADNLYSDYAHLPNEIRATLQMAKELSGKVVAVYQPHQNLRQHQIQGQYQDCFKEAAKVYWLPTYLTREDTSLPTLEPEALITKLSDQSSVVVATMDKQLSAKIKQHLAAGDTVVVMGAGSIDAWARQQLVN